MKKHTQRVVKKFVDKVALYVRGGEGAPGNPNIGAKGGSGGDVVVEASETAELSNVLRSLPTRRLVALPGGACSRTCLVGTSAPPSVVKVPTGCVVRSETNELLGELNKSGDRITVARGGAGGSPVNGYGGQLGQVRRLLIDLKLIADVGLVGFPNAGKSSILGTLTKAKPKIANYPFTTLQPQLGTIEFDDYRKITIADLPGLIEDAHLNKGRGHEFLKHLERTKLLLFVVDLLGFQLSLKERHRAAFETILLLNREIELYNARLTQTPAILVLNKSDLLDNTNFDLPKRISNQLEAYDETVRELQLRIVPENRVHFDHVVVFSVTKADAYQVAELKTLIRDTLDRHAKAAKAKETEKKQPNKPESDLKVYNEQASRLAYASASDWLMGRKSSK